MDQIPLSQERSFPSSDRGLGDEIHFTCQFFANWLMNWKTYPFVNVYINLVIEENRQACTPVEDVIGGAHAV